MRIFLAAVLLAVGLGACAAVSASNQPMRVEIWRGGDDGLTTRLADAMEDAFKNSHRFVLSSGKLPGTLIASIPTNVPWREVNGKTRVLYTIDFTDVDSKPVGQSTGQCWDDQLQKCADAIVGDAMRIADKIKTGN